jgi:hypothetical protein
MANFHDRLATSLKPLFSPWPAKGGVMCAVFSTNLKILEQSLSAEEAIELCTKVFTLVLCGFGLQEEEAHRIVSDSARDIVMGRSL